MSIKLNVNLGSRETSPQRVRNSSRHITSSLETSPASSHSASPLPPDSDGDEEEEFKDTLEVNLYFDNNKYLKFIFIQKITRVFDKFYFIFFSFSVSNSIQLLLFVFLLVLENQTRFVRFF